MVMSVEQSVEWMAGETEVLGENLPQYNFVHGHPARSLIAMITYPMLKFRYYCPHVKVKLSPKGALEAYRVVRC
jgi:hypothetical protein